MMEDVKKAWRYAKADAEDENQKEGEKKRQ